MCVDLKRKLREKGIEIGNDPLGVMKERAKDVLEYFEIVDIPFGGVPIVKILTRAGIKVYKDDQMDNDLSAFIAIDPELYENFGTNKLVCVNSNDSVEHIRFALAHELAHFLFDYDETEMVKYYNTYIANDSSNDIPEELRANKFAACLLMPEKEFIKAESELSKKGIKIDTIDGLSKKFGVSSKAILKRFEELGIAGYEV